MVSTIPYDKGWKIYENGKQVQVEKNWDNFLAFKLSDDEVHNITMKYRPVGFYSGVVISIVSFALLIGYCKKCMIHRII